MTILHIGMLFLFLIGCYIIFNRSNAKKSKYLSAPDKKNSINSSSESKFEFDEAIWVMAFLKENRSNFENQKKYLTALIERKMYPKLKVLAFKRSNSAASYEYLIVKTGSHSEYKRSIPSSIEDEVFKSLFPNEDFSIMHAYDNILNMETETDFVSDLTSFYNIKSEIDNGYYKLESLLSKVDQTENLNALESDKESKLEKIVSNRSFNCSCGQKHSLEEISSISVLENGLIVFTCPIDSKERHLWNPETWDFV